MFVDFTCSFMPRYGFNSLFLYPTYCSVVRILKALGSVAELGGAVIKLPPGAGAAIRIRLKILTILSKSLKNLVEKSYGCINPRKKVLMSKKVIFKNCL
jgi:hypothetical protein